MSFKNSETIFGGSRYNFGVEKITLSHDSFIETMINAQKGKKVATKKVEEIPVMTETTSVEENTDEKPKRTRKTVDKSVPEDGEKPKRHKRGEE